MIPLTLEEIARAVDGTAHGTAGPGLTVTARWSRTPAR